jgi:CheY-like chemotaxis protein
MAFGALIVDDQDDVRTLIRMIIDAANEGLFVKGDAASGFDALARLEELDPDVIVLDEMMPGMNGLEVARAIARRRPGQMMILCSAYLDEHLRREAVEAGILLCLTKDEVEKIPAALRALAEPDVG